MSRQSIIDTAAAEKGTKENPPNSNKTKYGEWYGLNAKPWCAIFVSWVYDSAGHPLGKVDTAKGYQYCPSAYNFWKANSRLTDNPKTGDIVLFDWTGDGKPDHTGIFINWVEPGKKFTSWEGNTSVNNDSDGGEVMLRTRSKSVVKAFVNAGVFGEAAVATPSTLKVGTVGTDVTRIQKILYDLKYTVTVDGEFGAATERVVKQFQQDHGIAQSGIVDLVTEGALEAEISRPNVKNTKLTTGVYLRKGDAGSAVVALQQALNKKGARPKIEEDGVFGPVTVVALKAFQKSKGLTQDGVAGPESLNKLGIK